MSQDEIIPCPFCGTRTGFRSVSAIRRAEGHMIRAFVERAEARLPGYSTGRGADDWLKNYHRAVKDELDAMQQETE